MIARSSGRMSSASGSPPASTTPAASEKRLMSRTWPARGVSRGSTNSSPVGRIATLGRRWTSTDVTPTPASAPTSWLLRRAPARRINSPSFMSSPTPRTFSPTAAGRLTSRVSSSGAVVNSSITTASAPSGTMPPVRMRAASPRPTENSGAAPIGTWPTISRYAGIASLAPKESEALSA